MKAAALLVGRNLFEVLEALFTTMSDAICILPDSVLVNEKLEVKIDTFRTPPESFLDKKMKFLSPFNPQNLLWQYGATLLYLLTGEEPMPDADSLTYLRVVSTKGTIPLPKTLDESIAKTIHTCCSYKTPSISMVRTIFYELPTIQEDTHDYGFY